MTMRRMAILSVVACFFISAAFAADGPLPPSPAAPQIVDLTEAFTRAFDDTAGQPEAERIKAFKARVAPLLPTYYGIARFNGQVTQDARDRQIARAFERFPEIRDLYTAKAEKFRADMAANIESFRVAFPEFTLERPVYLLHSLGEMDGGTRDLNGVPRLIFGADGMAMYHQGWHSESAFFHHELFHIHHRPKLGECETVWCMLWIEGVAVHVAATLNPAATEAELLLDFPAGSVGMVRAKLPAALAHTKRVLDSTNTIVLRALFSSGKDDTGLPPRRGYLVGYLLAREVARHKSLQELALLPHDEVRAAMALALDTLIQKAP